MHTSKVKLDHGRAAAARSLFGPCMFSVATHRQRFRLLLNRWDIHAAPLRPNASGDAHLADNSASGPQPTAAHAGPAAVASGAPDTRSQRRATQVDDARQQQRRPNTQGLQGSRFADSMPSSSIRQRQGVPSWQIRQQQQQSKQQQPQKRQKRQRTGALKAKKQHVFSNCCSYQSLLDSLPLQQQPQNAPLASAEGQQCQQQMWRPPLSSGDCVDLVKQLAVISKSSSSSSVGGSSSFVEDQALLQVLPLVYDTLDYFARPQQQVPTAAATPAAEATTAANSPHSALQPPDLLRCISTLAALKYSQPARLAALLDLRSAGRPGLSCLRMQQLSGLVAALTRAGVKPSNAWLLALMQEAERRLPTASLPQLAQLLHGLVKMGVKPAASWLDSLQDQAVQCLIEQAVRCQVSHDQLQGLQQQQQQHSQQQFSRPTAELNSSGGAGAVGDSRSLAACQLHDIAKLLTALAESRHSPKPQLSAALWGATASSLAAADVAALVELLSALGELQLVPPVSWMEQYYSSTTVYMQQGQYKPWQLAESVQALGRLAQVGLQCCSSNEVYTGTQLQQAVVGSTALSAVLEAPATAKQLLQIGGAGPQGLWDCSRWVATVLSVVQQQLSSFAARDIAALLSGLAALHRPMNTRQLQAILCEAEHKLPRLNTAGLTMLAEAAAELENSAQAQAQQQQQEEPVLLTSSWMGSFLQEAAVKLPMFPADDLARLLIALSKCSVCKPSSIWLEAAAGQLQSKLTVLDPCMITQVMTAIAALGYTPGQHWLKTAVAAVEGRAIELGLADVEHLLVFLSSVGYKPDPSFLATARWIIQEQQQQQQLGGQQQQPLAGMTAQRGVLSAEEVHERVIESESTVQKCERLLQQVAKSCDAPGAAAGDTCTSVATQASVR